MLINSLCSSTPYTKQVSNLENCTLLQLKNKEATVNLTLASSISDIETLWTKIQPESNLFLQVNYLKTLENHPPEGMQFRYLVLHDDKQVLGLVYTQIYKINLDETLSNTNPESKETNCIVTAFTKAIKKWVLKKAEFNLLVCGNLTLSGQYGFHFIDAVDEATQYKLLSQSINALQHKLDEDNQKISIILFKDYDLDFSNELKKTLETESYSSFMMQPSMHLDIKEEWQTYNDYTAAMTSKYRTRVKRARKKGAGIIKRALTLEEIEQYEDRIYELYGKVANGVGFNAYYLEKSYFTQLKRSLGENYQLIGYFLDGEFIAFCTAIFNGTKMDAHFLGFDGAYNRTHQIYLNILYDLVEFGIENNSKHIDFARTALEIKSSIGATPNHLICFFKHRSTFSSQILQRALEYLNPKEEWTQRSPFKLEPKPEAVKDTVKNIAS